MEELDIQLGDSNSINEGECPHCGVPLTDNCPPDYDMNDTIDCPACNKPIYVNCDVTIEREYSFEIPEDFEEEEKEEKPFTTCDHDCNKCIIKESCEESSYKKGE